MKRKKTPQEPRNKGADRDERLKAALKANMARRKSQARARADNEADRSQTEKDQ
ncbi:hypothetical protein [Aliiroseovarius sediminis]|uniref:hypothetical protein n=1 Tax=Aliiroseovarius sediminis TaxID=2925839 RepID=UPI001F576387|nr:hypothetical protein [Aliiroseovarius sediminis]MCI2395086.1 hypothetical protein [Aliiroseovarius sediminis]